MLCQVRDINPNVCTQNKNGYTFIEILTVVAVIGILAAIAIPGYSAYKIRAYNATAESDLHNLYKCCKSFWAANTSTSECTLPLVKQSEYGFNQSASVEIKIDPEQEGDFEASAFHSGGDKGFNIDSKGNITTVLLASLKKKKGKK